MHSKPIRNFQNKIYRNKLLKPPYIKYSNFLNILIEENISITHDLYISRFITTNTKSVFDFNLDKFVQY